MELSIRQSAQEKELGSKSRTPSSSDCKGELLTLISTEERTTPELSGSSSHFGVVCCWAIEGQDARQWPGLPHAKHVPGLGRAKRPGTRDGIGRAWLGGVDSADAGNFFFFFNVLHKVRARDSALNIRFSSSESSVLFIFGDRSPSVIGLIGQKNMFLSFGNQLLTFL